MRQKSLKISLLAGAFGFGIVGCFASVALAHDGTSDSTTNQTQNETEHTSGEDSTTSTTSHSGKLMADKLKVCQVHEKVIDSNMTRIGTRGERHLSVFDAKAQRVEAFATTKGTKPANYDALVADVNAKQAAAKAAVEQVKTDRVSFKCDGSDPKGVASSFKADLKAEITALQAYKKSIRNLLIAVMKANNVTPETNSTSGGTEQ